MNPSANVLQTATLVDFRAALCTFADGVRDALGMLQMDIRRAGDWLEQQRGEWHAAVRLAEDQVFQAKSELTRRRMMRIGDRVPDCTEVEAALSVALQRLDFARDKLTKCKRWQRAWPEALIDFQGPANRLQGLGDGDIPRMLTYLEQKIASLEAYTA